MKNKFSLLRFFNPFLKLWLCFLIQIKMMDDGNLYDQSLNSNCLFLMLLCYLCTHKVFFCFTKKEQGETSYPAAWIRKQFWGKKGLNIFFCCAAERRIFHPDYRKNLWDSWKYLQNRAKCCFKYRQVTFIFQKKRMLRRVTVLVTQKRCKLWCVMNYWGYCQQRNLCIWLLSWISACKITKPLLNDAWILKPKHALAHLLLMFSTDEHSSAIKLQCSYSRHISTWHQFIYFSPGRRKTWSLKCNHCITNSLSRF